jgi:hypothetical protein
LAVSETLCTYGLFVTVRTRGALITLNTKIRSLSDTVGGPRARSFPRIRSTVEKVAHNHSLTPAQEKIEPERLAKFPPAATLREAVLLLARLARDPAFLDARVYPILEGARRAEDWYLARSYEARDGSCSLQVFVRP